MGAIRSLFLNENGWIAIRISLKYVPKGRINAYLSIGWW